MTSIADPNAKTRLQALRVERDDLNERMQDLIDEATHHATVGRMDRWAATRERIRAAGEHLSVVNEQIAALEFGRGSRAVHPTRTQSQQVER